MESKRLGAGERRGRGGIPVRMRLASQRPVFGIFELWYATGQSRNTEMLKYSISAPAAGDTNGCICVQQHRHAPTILSDKCVEVDDAAQHVATCFKQYCKGVSRLLCS